MLNKILFELEIMGEILDRHWHVWLVPILFVVFALFFRHFVLTPDFGNNTGELAQMANQSFNLVKNEYVLPIFDLAVLIIYVRLFFHLYFKERNRLY